MILITYNVLGLTLCKVLSLISCNFLIKLTLLKRRVNLIKKLFMIEIDRISIKSVLNYTAIDEINWLDKELLKIGFKIEWIWYYIFVKGFIS